MNGKVELKQSTDYVIGDFLQTITNKNKKKVQVFDFDKIDKVPHFVVVIASQRGQLGKTYNIKVKMIEDWKRYGRKSLFARNLKSDIQKEQAKFLSENDTPPQFKGCKFTGSAKSNTLWVADQNGEKFIRMASINVAEDEKGSRVIYKNIVIDEFNVNSNLVQNYIEKFDSLLHSTEDIVNDQGKKSAYDEKVYLFANNKSLSHPMFISLGITSIKAEISEVFLDGHPSILIIWPRPTDEDKIKFEMENSMNPRYKLSKILGTADHSYFNQSLFDQDNFVEAKIEKTKKLLGPSQSIKDYFKVNLSVFHKDQYYNIYDISKDLKCNIKTNFHIKQVKKSEVMKIKGKNIIIAFRQNDKMESVLSLTSQKYKKRLNRLLSEDLISFENVASRDLFISSIK